jgi:hypothetical protein
MNKLYAMGVFACGSKVLYLFWVVFIAQPGDKYHPKGENPCGA